ncbi:MAG: hypothetical protein ABIO70_11515 [Pseudomonadota bacterium]
MSTPMTIRCDACAWTWSPAPSCGAGGGAALEPLACCPRCGGAVTRGPPA